LIDPQSIIDEAIDQWQTYGCVQCVKAMGRHFEHLLRFSQTTGFFQSHFRPTKTAFFKATHTIVRKTT